MKRERNSKPDTLQIVHQLDTQRAEITRLKEQLAITSYHHGQAEEKYRKALLLLDAFVTLADGLNVGDTISQQWIRDRDEQLVTVAALLQSGGKA